MEPSTTGQRKFTGLPLIIVSPVDVSRLIRELETIDNYLLQQTVQKHELKMPTTTKLMDELIQLNKLNLLDKPERQQTQKFLTAIKQRAPLLHISFSADPSPLFIEKLMFWLRENIHPLVLLTVGLQPNIGAGCLVRTSNKYFDFSLNKHLSEDRTLLMKTLRDNILAAATPKPATATTAQPVGVAA
jgi:hypothetical protein